MKNFLLGIFVLLLILIIGAGVFIATLDLDKYRPQIVEKLESTIGMPVELERISLGWHEGLALSLNGLVIEDRVSQKPLLDLSSAKLVLDLAPLLNRQIQITTLYLNRPVFNLIRTRDGKIQGLDAKPTSPESTVQTGKPGTSAGGSETVQSAGALSFFVGGVRVDSGELHFRDEMRPVPSEIEVHDIDIQLRNVALNEPIDMDIKAGVLSSHQNINARGTLRVSPKEQRLSNFHGELNLAAIDPAQLAQFAPGLEGARVTGQLSADISSLMLNADALRNILAEMHLTDGSIQSRTLPEIKNLGADIFAQAGNMKIQNFSADYAGGKISGQGNVNLKMASPLVALNAQLKNLPIQNLSEPSGGNQPQMKGTLSAGFEGTFSADNPAKSLAGEGKIVIEDGVIENFNILKEVFKKLSMIPGLVDKLMTRLPENYKERLNAKNTYLENVQTPFTVQNGTAVLNRMDIRSDSFALQGAGSLGLESMRLAGQGSLFIDPDLSAALIESVKELQSLADRNGLIQIPLNFQGQLPQISVTPDLQYIGSRLAMATTQDVLAGLFKKPETGASPGPGGTSQPVSNSTQQSSADPQAQPAKQKAPKASAILGQLLESALAPQEEQTTRQ